MWNAASGKKTFTGPYALMLAYSLQEMVEKLEYCYEVDENDHCFGCKAFACLTLEQKVWTLHKVTFGLLDRKTPIVPLTAYLEAAVATIFDVLEDLVEIEIDMFRDAVNESDEEQNWCFDVRRAILTVHEKEGRNLPPFVEADEKPLTLKCENIKEWKMAIEYMVDEILWDADYDMDMFVDMPPKACAETKAILGIVDDYYSSIPNDPTPEEAGQLLKETNKLCQRVINREKNKLKKKRN
jgi:hypothetical protein